MEYKLKQIPKDFLVWEIPIYDLDDKGEFAYFWMRKTDYNTLDAVQTIAKRLNLPLKKIGYAGTKDKQAITEQLISIKSVNHEKIEDLRLKDIELDYIGQGNKPISLGDLKGNKFRITVRSLHKRFTIPPPERIPNLFGDQRFSINNAEIGKLLIKKNFKKALDLIDQKDSNNYLDSNPGDFVGALRQIPLKLAKFYIHSYQSLLWNETVNQYLKTKPWKNEKIPVIGFGLEPRPDRLGSIIKQIMLKEQINHMDFVLRQIPELSAESGERDLYIKPENFEMSIEEDDLNKGKFKAVVSFTLPKSSYATVVIDYLFSKLV